ncbi:MAG: isoprenylcysteine carboxylmethyltransferase family protein [Terracidiphilus sp.]|jgi:protein-S-isoprenylcysteine O-methyltransferase Ste14
MLVRVLWPWLLFGWVGFEVLVTIITQTRRSQGALHDRGTQILIWVAITGSFFAAGFVAFPGADIRFNHDFLRMAAFVLLVAGLVVRIAAIVNLGRAFSTNVAIRSAQSVQRNGLYRIVRHPSYLGTEIILLAAGLHTHNWACLAIFAVLPTAAVLNRIRVEEAALLNAFGEEYADYMRTTKRLIPGVY